MKKLIVAAALVSLSLVTGPAWAVDAHDHAKSDDQSIEEMTMDESSPTSGELKDIREKLEQETDPAKRRDMMHKHMMMMREGMHMMSQMGGKPKAMAHGGPGGDKPMDHRMSMMEQKMAMMEKMMGGGKMKCGMMDGGMMGGHGGAGGHGAGQKDAGMKMMEKKMEMMQEIVNGLLVQQELNTEKPN